METTEKTASGKSKFSDPITLSESIKRGETSIDSIILRRPKTGELRGLNMQDLIQSDVNSIITLIPRISQPTLTPEETADLDPADFTEITGAIRGFFMTKVEVEAIEKMLGQQISTT